MKNKGLLLLIIGIIIGTLVHLTTVKAATPTASSAMNAQAVNNAFNSKATNFRLELNSLLREHAALGAMTLTALYQGANTNELMQLMNKNQQQLTALVGQVYGTNVANQFNTLWTQHMNEYKNYVLAKKNNNTAKMNQAKKNLQTISAKLGTLLDNAGTHLSASTVSSLMQQHVTGTLAIVDAVAAKNPTATADAIKKGYDQAGQFADVLAQGMILDKPNIFTQ